MGKNSFSVLCVLIFRGCKEAKIEPQSSLFRLTLFNNARLYEANQLLNPS
jgi:hypothetical protein